MSEFSLNQSSHTIQGQRIGGVVRITVNGDSTDMDNLELQALKEFITDKIKTHSPRTGMRNIKKVPVSVNGLKFIIDDYKLKEFLTALNRVSSIEIETPVTIRETPNHIIPQETSRPVPQETPSPVSPELTMKKKKLVDVSLKEIDTELNDGKIVPLKDIEFRHGIACYEGRQVLIYQADMNRFHVASCSQFRDLLTKGKNDPYLITNKFKISGQPCRTCLSSLNYQNYKYGDKNDIFNRFSIEECFATFSSYFDFMPKNAVHYSHDKWSVTISHACHECDVKLEEGNLIHIDQVKGVKLTYCLDCHRKHPLQPRHIFVRHQDILRINTLRKYQKITNPTSWEKVEKFLDPALIGSAAFCKHHNIPAPELGISISTAHEYNIALDLAWPNEKVAFIIADDDRQIAQEAGWDCPPIFETFRTYESFGTFLITPK